jgi:hypothetical protein
MDNKKNINIEIEQQEKYNFCNAVNNVRKFCLIDSRVRDKEAIECDIYTWLIKKINCDPNIDKFD